MSIVVEVIDGKSYVEVNDDLRRFLTVGEISRMGLGNLTDWFAASEGKPMSSDVFFACLLAGCTELKKELGGDGR